MSQHSFLLSHDDYPSGLLMRAALQDALQALASNNYGPAAPSPAYPGQLWPDSTSGYLKQRNKDNNAWVVLWPLDQRVLVCSGGSNAYAVSRAPLLNAYVHGCVYSFQADVANTGAATFNDSTVGAKDLKKLINGAYTALAAGDIPAGHLCRAQYDSNAEIFVLLNPSISTSDADFIPKAIAMIKGSDGSVFTSKNIASVTHVSTGRFLIVFTNPAPTNNYVVLLTNLTGEAAPHLYFTSVESGTMQTAQFQVLVTDAGQNKADPEIFYLACFWTQ